MQIVYLLLIGTISYLSQVAVVLALQLVDSGTFALLIKSLDIIMSFTADIFYFGIIPNEIAIVGVVIMLATVFGSVICQQHRTISNNNEEQFQKCLGVCNNEYKQIE